MTGKRVTTVSDAEVAALLGLEPLDRSTPSGSEQVPELDALVGRRVRAARRRSGLGAAALAEQVGLTQDKLSKIENGRRRVAPRVLPALAHALHVPLSDLLGAADTTDRAGSLHSRGKRSGKPGHHPVTASITSQQQRGRPRQLPEPG